MAPCADHLHRCAPAELVHQVGPSHADRVGHGLRQEPAGGGDGKRKACLSGRACSRASRRISVSMVLRPSRRSSSRTRFSISRTRLIGTTPSSALTAFCPPSAMRCPHWNSRLGETPREPGDGGDRHAWLHGLLDQPDLLLGSVAPPAMDAGNDLNALDGLRHERVPRREPRPAGLCRLSGRTGGRSTPIPADRPRPYAGDDACPVELRASAAGDGGLRAHCEYLNSTNERMHGGWLWLKRARAVLRQPERTSKR